MHIYICRYGNYVIFAVIHPLIKGEISRIIYSGCISAKYVHLHRCDCGQRITYKAHLNVCIQWY